jgi:hypothetical protein
MRRTAWLMTALMVLALPLAGAAQPQTGVISGVVRDPTGAVVPGVTVNVTPGRARWFAPLSLVPPAAS